MTLDQFDNLAISEIGAAWPELRAMVADNARLRGLVKAAQWSGGYGYECEPVCPWCDANPTDKEPHTADCPAFTPTGEVK